MAAATLLVGLLAMTAFAEAAQVSGHIELHGPKRKLNVLQVNLHEIGSNTDLSLHGTQSVHSDARGNFKFVEVKPGIYLLRVKGPGVLSAQWGAIGPELPGRALVIHSSDKLTDVVVPVSSRPVLCGRVFGVDGNPVGRADVHVWKTAPGAGMWMGGGGDGTEDGGNATTDRRGRYRLDYLTMGSYIVGSFLRDAANGRPYEDSAGRFWQDSPDSESATIIELRPGPQTDSCPYNLRLKAFPEPYNGPRYYVEGSPIADVATLGPRALDWKLSPLDTALRLEEVLPKSEPFDARIPAFKFMDVPPGRYRLTLSDRLPWSFSGPCSPIWRNEVDQEIDVESNISAFHVDLIPAATIRGHVKLEKSENDAVWPEDWHKLDGVDVTDSYGECTGTGISADGSFEIGHLDPGRYDISAHSNPIGIDYTSLVTLNGRPSEGGALNLSAGDNVVEITVRLDFGEVDATIEATTVDGVSERNDQNKWLGGAERALLLDHRGKIFSSTIGVGQGTFRGPLPPGHYTAIAGHNDQFGFSSSIDEELLKALAPLGTAFDIEPGQTTKATLYDRTVEIQDTSARLALPIL